MAKTRDRFVLCVSCKLQWLGMVTLGCVLVNLILLSSDVGFFQVQFCDRVPVPHPCYTLIFSLSLQYNEGCSRVGGLERGGC